MSNRYRPKTKTETKEYLKWKELASMKGKVLCTIQDLKRLMGKQEFLDAAYEQSLKPVTVIAYRSYFFWPPDEETGLSVTGGT